jgi:AcrR family transcriptional regulator
MNAGQAPLEASEGSGRVPERGTGYRSPLRRAQAAETRRRIAAAAGALFIEQGFSATTVAAIARRAGVAVQTVYATFGSKGAIVHAVLAQMEDEADAGVWRERIASETDPRRKLAAFAAWSARMYSTSKPAIALAQAAGSDPSLAALKAEGDRHRREALDSLVRGLDRSGSLVAGLTVEEAADRAWVLTAVELYLAAVDGCGWSDDRYAEWLGSLLADQLLGGGSGT